MTLPKSYKILEIEEQQIIDEQGNKKEIYRNDTEIILKSDFGKLMNEIEEKLDYTDEVPNHKIIVMRSLTFCGWLRELLEELKQ